MKSGLIPFKKGQSGNPSGRPKGAQSIPEILRRYGMLETPEQLLASIRKVFPYIGTRLTLLESACVREYIEALKGDTKALGWIADRLEGKPNQNIKLEETGGRTIIKIGGVDISREPEMDEPEATPEKQTEPNE